MMKLEHGRAQRVPAIKAATTACCDELKFPPLAAALLASVGLRVAQTAALLSELLRLGDGNRSLRGVVGPERRARQTETAAVERPHPLIDHHFGGKRLPT